MGDEGKAGTNLSDQAAEWLVALDCGAADRHAFEAWRSADPRHAAAFAQVAATWRRTADPRLPALLEESPAPAPEVEPAPLSIEPKALSRRAVTGSLVAAALGLGGAATYLAWPRRAYAATAVGERRTIRLPDGSHAMLNTDTRVGWRFDEGRDFWIERGEAILLVGAAPTPFRLYSDPIDARLSGGRFDIRVEPDKGRLVVLAGRAAAAYHGTLAQTVHAGSALTVDGEGARIARLSPGTMAVATAWQRGEIVFNGMTLGEAVAEYNRYLPDKIMIEDSSLAATRLGGAFRIDAPDAFLLALRDGFDIDHRRDADRVLLFARGKQRMSQPGP